MSPTSANVRPTAGAAAQPIETIMPSGQGGEMTGIIDAYLTWLAGKPVYATIDTLTLRRSVLRRLDAELPYGIAETCGDDLHAWLYRPEWSPNTRATYYRAIKSFYGWASDPRDPWIDINPADDLEAARGVDGVARPVTDDQLLAVLSRAAEPYRTWATIAAYNGLRCMEIAGLDREHVTEQRLVVNLGKGKRARFHDTDPYVWAAVKDLPPGPIARRVGGDGRETAARVSRRANDYFRIHLGLDITMHQFRHWLGCSVLDATNNLRKVQEMLGHKRITSTEIYTRVTLEQQAEARATIPRLAG